MVLGLPYMYRSVDTGMRTVDVRTLTEAAQSLGANWFVTIMTRVILPESAGARCSAASLLTFAIVVGEVVLASFLGCPAFGPYLFLLGQHRAFEPAALTFVNVPADLGRDGNHPTGDGRAGPGQPAHTKAIEDIQ